MRAATLHHLLDTRLPIIQAPMAGVQGAALAVATTNAGGLGSLPCATLAPAAMETELTHVTRDAHGAVNVNFFCHEPPVFDEARDDAWRAALAPYFAEFGVDPQQIPRGPGRVPFNHDVADALEPFRPAVVSFHFGLPAPALLERVRGWGAKILSTATTVDEARWLEARGVSGIIAQGFEAGGHRGMFLSDDLHGQLGTFTLLPQVVRAVRVPVIAAGGIADPRGVAAAVALGAAGVQVGTSYLLCPEVHTTPLHRRALRDESRTALTAVTNLLTGRPARGMFNRVMRELGPMCPLAPTFPLATAAMTALRAAAEREQRDDFSSLWAGQNTTGCREVPAAEITQALMDGIALG